MMRKIDVTAIGNAIVDVIASTDDAFLATECIKKGSMNLIESERAASLYKKMKSPIIACGGSAANTVVGLSSLGANCAFIGKVRNDDAGAAFQSNMDELNIAFKTPHSTKGLETAKCLVFVTPDAQRSMNTFLGASIDLSPKDISPSEIQNSQLVYLEGYLWDPPQAKDAFLKAIEIAKASQTKVALSLSDSFCVERFRKEFRDLIVEHVDILFANQAEIIALYETETFDAAAMLAKQHCDTLALTRDALGSVILTGDTVLNIGAEKITNVVDTTGAGDLYAAGFLYGFTHNMKPKECGRLGSLVAGQIIQHFGARPEKSLKPLIAQAASGG